MRHCREKWMEMRKKLAGFLPEEFCGSKKILSDLYESRYWRKDADSLAEKTRGKTAETYLLIVTVTIFLVLCSLLGSLGQGSHHIRALERPAYGESPRNESLTAEIRYGEERIKKNISLRVKPVLLSEKAVSTMLDDLSGRLPQLILGENENLLHVKKDLDLITVDKKTGALLAWESEDPFLVTEEGRINTLLSEKEKKGKKVLLKAVMTLLRQEKTAEIPVTVFPDAGADPKIVLEERFGDVVSQLEEKNPRAKVIDLPVELSEETKILWYPKKENLHWKLLFLGMGLLLFVYLQRYQGAKKALKKEREMILEDLPEFANRLALLIAAGLVTEAAVCKIAWDYGRRESREKKPLYEGLHEIEARLEKSNASFAREFADFSQRTQVRELIRLQTIIAENLHTGNSLCEKLEAEAELLWIYKKKNVEEKGRIAETKLTFPLLIQLLVLILITLAPIFLGL